MTCSKSDTYVSPGEPSKPNNGFCSNVSYLQSHRQTIIHLHYLIVRCLPFASLQPKLGFPTPPESPHLFIRRQHAAAARYNDSEDELEFEPEFQSSCALADICNYGNQRQECCKHAITSSSIVDGLSSSSSSAWYTLISFPTRYHIIMVRAPSWEGMRYEDTKGTSKWDIGALSTRTSRAVRPFPRRIVIWVYVYDKN
jgi:hypothetical protein